MSTERSRKASAVLGEILGDQPVTFGAMLRSIRLCDEASLAQFAARLGVSRQNLADIEAGRRRVSLARAGEWARRLGRSETQFLSIAIEDELRAADALYSVKLEPAAKRAG